MPRERLPAMPNDQAADAGAPLPDRPNATASPIAAPGMTVSEPGGWVAIDPAVALASRTFAHTRRGFERRAAKFDRVAFLPREIASRMHERLDYIKTSPLRIVDAGCGPGSDLPRLAQRYPLAQLIGIDATHAMLRIAADGAAHRSGDSAKAAAGGAGAGGGHSQAATDPAAARPSLTARLSRSLPQPLRRLLGEKSPWLIEADYTDLPLAAGSVDLLWSNLALQWHPLPDRVFPSWQRVLAVGGLLMFSTLGPDTLQEVRRAWRLAWQRTYGADDPAAAAERPIPPGPVRSFVDMHDFGDMLVASGFAEPVMDMERLVITYRDAAALLADVRAWGPPSLPEAARGLSGRKFHAAWLDALGEQRRADGTIGLTFEVIYGHAWKVAPKQTGDGRAIVRIDEIGGRGGKRSDGGNRR